MLKRKIYSKLIDWKRDKKNKSLLIKGARQVGKTFIVNYFGKQEYKNYIYINFIEKEKYCKIFEEDISADEIYKKLTLEFDEKIDLSEKTH